MGLAQEFKDFAMRGNVVDMAVGIIIGAAFGKIVSAFVGKIITPVIGLIVGGVNFTDLAITLKEAGGAEGKPVLMEYGVFLQSVFDFIVVAFAIFMAIRAMNSMKKKEETAAPAAPPAQEVLLTEIRDALRK